MTGTMLQAPDFVVVRTDDGVFYGLPTTGQEEGSQDIVVFGYPAPKGKDGKSTGKIAAHLIENVPFGARGGDGRKSLKPYWERR